MYKIGHESCSVKCIIADRSAVVGDRGLAGAGATVRHKAPVKAGGGDRGAATTRGRDRRRSRERDGLAAAHGPGAVLRNSEEEAWADPRLSDGGARPGLSHRRPGAGMRRAIQDATACREALLRLPKLGLGELRQQWRVLYKAEASQYLSHELLLRAVAYRMQEVALGGLRPERQRQLGQFAQQLNGSQEVRIRPRPELKPGTRLVREWQGRTYDVLVLDDGFSWQGTSYRSLSALAGKITGTAWSGPLFFGLKANRTAALAPARGPRTPGADADAATGREPQTLRDLRPQILRGRARAGIQFARGAARSLRGLHSQPAARGLAVGENPL